MWNIMHHDEISVQGIFPISSWLPDNCVPHDFQDEMYLQYTSNNSDQHHTIMYQQVSHQDG